MRPQHLRSSLGTLLLLGGLVAPAPSSAQGRSPVELRVSAGFGPTTHESEAGLGEQWAAMPFQATWIRGGSELSIRYAYFAALDVGLWGSGGGLRRDDSLQELALLYGFRRVVGQGVASAELAASAGAGLAWARHVQPVMPGAEAGYDSRHPTLAADLRAVWLPASWMGIGLTIPITVNGDVSLAGFSITGEVGSLR